MDLPDVSFLTLREQAAQLVMPRLGSNMQPTVRVEDDVERALALLERCPVGGFVLFNGDAGRTPTALRRLQKAANVPLLIGSDLERGAGQQLAGATVFPHAMAFGALEEGAGEAVRQLARITAREALACGIQLVFAPVADVNRNPRNPIIATRAFGTEPHRVGDLAARYVEACREEGLLTCGKHAPGHGGTSADSHETLPVVDDPVDVLEAEDLAPFRAVIDAGADALMTAHVAYSALDGSGRAATMSRTILQDVLRGRLGFDGPILSDSLLMAPIRDAFPDAGAQAVALVEAGVDVLLDHPDAMAAVEALVEAVEDGMLPAERLETACARVLALKQQFAVWHGHGAFRHPDRIAQAEVGTAEHQRSAGAIARRAVTFPAGEQAWTHFGGLDDRSLAIFLHTEQGKTGAEPLAALLQEAFPGISYSELGPAEEEARFQRVLRQASEAERVLVAIAVKPAAWRTYGLSSQQRGFVDALLQSAQVGLAALGNPEVLADYRGLPQLCTYSDVPLSQYALVEALRELAPAVR